MADFLKLLGSILMGVGDRILLKYTCEQIAVEYSVTMSHTRINMTFFQHIFKLNSLFHM